MKDMKDTEHLMRSALLSIAHERRLNHKKGTVRLFLAEDYLQKALRQLARFNELHPKD